MSKKVIISLVLGLLVIGLLIPTIFAAEESDETLENLFGQMHQLRRQVVERRVELGQLTPEQAEQIQNRMEERYQQRLEDGFACPGGGFGKGMGRGEGRGMRDGSCGNWER